jgi:diguanylate cyclase (GGDEF)-like protein
MPDTLALGPTWWPIDVAWRQLASPGVRRITALWLVIAVLGVIMAIAEAGFGWSGLPVTVGGFTVGVTVYPPLLVTVMLTIWLGPVWGMLPGYAATFASGLLGGMTVPVAALFAAVTPLELLLIWGSMVTLDIHPDLRGLRHFVLYLVVTLIAATASSLAALMWNNAQGLDLVTGQRIWQGWLIGDLIQFWLLVPPLLHWMGPTVRPWIDRQMGIPPRRHMSYIRTAVLMLIALGLLGVLVFQGVGMAAEALQVAASVLTPQGTPVLAHFGEIGLFLALLFAVTLLTTSVFSAALASIGERERRHALRDVLTGCFNRRAFPDLFQREVERSRRLGQGVSVVFFDIDSFKVVNDEFGHEVGDRVLRLLPNRVRGVMREHDLLFRWGGEEFLVLLPHTGPTDAQHLAERIRQTVTAVPLVTQGIPRPIGVTLSLGTAATEEYPVNADRLIAQADAACYAAKRRGRNRVVGAGGSSPPPPAPQAVPPNPS